MKNKAKLTDLEAQQLGYAAKRLYEAIGEICSGFCEETNRPDPQSRTAAELTLLEALMFAVIEGAISPEEHSKAVRDLSINVRGLLTRWQAEKERRKKAAN